MNAWQIYLGNSNNAFFSLIHFTWNSIRSVAYRVSCMSMQFVKWILTWSSQAFASLHRYLTTRLWYLLFRSVPSSVQHHSIMDFNGKIFWNCIQCEWDERRRTVVVYETKSLKYKSNGILVHYINSQNTTNNWPHIICNGMERRNGEKIASERDTDKEKMVRILNRLQF